MRPFELTQDFRDNSDRWVIEKNNHCIDNRIIEDMLTTAVILGTDIKQNKVEFPIKYSPHTYCGECGEKLNIEIIENRRIIISSTEPHREVGVYSINIDIPSGKIAFGNDMRLPYQFDNIDFTVSRGMNKIVCSDLFQLDCKNEQ